MLTFKKIETTNNPGYKFIEELLISSFPQQEYRPLSEQRNNVENNPLFNLILIEDVDIKIGFISYWQLGDFFYVEHLATHPDSRNGGYGKKIMEKFIEELNNIILEVELPDNELANRRIGFYQRQGFELWENIYMQPPYRKGDSLIEMKLMASGQLDQNIDFQKIKESIHKIVYNYNT